MNMSYNLKDLFMAILTLKELEKIEKETETFILKEKIKTLNKGKKLYAIIAKNKIFEVESQEIFLKGKLITIITKPYASINYSYKFFLGISIFETKEEALDKIIEIKQNKMKDLAIQFKKEKQFLEEILEDVEKVFVKLKDEQSNHPIGCDLVCKVNDLILPVCTY